MLLKTYILPHSPVLIPAIGKANTAILAKTNETFEEIINELKEIKIGSVIIITPHGPSLNEGFVLNIAPEFQINFESFGDFATKASIKGDIRLAQTIKEKLQNEFSLQVTSQEVLDYGSAVPLYKLLPLIKDCRVLPITYCPDSIEKNFSFGEALKKIIDESNDSILLIASGDLSHRLKKGAPGGYSPKGAKFDNKLIEYLSSPKTARENIEKMDNNIIKDAMECGLKSIALALGVCGQSYEIQILAYQTELGIGYLSAQLETNKKDLN